MDVFSDVLRAVRLTGAVFFDVDFTAPWVAETPAGEAIAAGVMPDAEHVIMFHAITSGGGWAELLDDSLPPFRLSAGDIIVLPMSDAHVLCSQPGMRATPDLAMYRRPADRHLPIYVEKGDGRR